MMLLENDPDVVTPGTKLAQQVIWWVEIFEVANLFRCIKVFSHLKDWNRFEFSYTSSKIGWGH